MDHAITVKNVLIIVAVVGGIAGLCVVAFVVLDLLNPFRSGH